MFEKYAYLSQNANDSYVYETITDRLRNLVEKNPDKNAIIFYSLQLERRLLTRRELLQKSLNFASNLIKIGVKKDDLILVCLNNSIELCISLFGIMFSGGTQYHVSLNNKDGKEIVDLINQTNCKYLILDADNETKQNIDKYNESVKIILLKKSNNQNDLYDFNEFSNTFDENVTLPILSPEDNVLYFSTSGSTGKKKLTTCTHFYLLNSMIVSSESFEATEDDIHFNDRPIPWTVGFPRMFLSHGCTRVIVDTRLTISGKNLNLVCDIISKEKCTIVYLPCYLIFDFLQNKPDEELFKSVKNIYSGGQKIRKTFTGLINKYCKKFFVWYGSTEIATVSIFQDNNPDNYEDGIIGRPMYGSEMKVVDQNLNTVRIGEKGFLMTRNILRFTDYKNRECCCGAQPISNNYWYDTGDIAHLREDGNFIVHGRKTETVTVGTMKYLPNTIECHYLNYPGVKEAYAVSVPDDRLFETCCLCVVTKNDAKLTSEELENYSNEIFNDKPLLSGQSIKPQYHIILDKLPLNENGKVSRKHIQEEAIKILNLI